MQTAPRTCPAMRPPGTPAPLGALVSPGRTTGEGNPPGAVAPAGFPSPACAWASGREAVRLLPSRMPAEGCSPTTADSLGANQFLAGARPISCAGLTYGSRAGSGYLSMGVGFDGSTDRGAGGAAGLGAMWRRPSVVFVVRLIRLAALTGPGGRGSGAQGARAMSSRWGFALPFRGRRLSYVESGAPLPRPPGPAEIGLPALGC